MWSSPLRTTTWSEATTDQVADVSCLRGRSSRCLGCDCQSWASEPNEIAVPVRFRPPALSSQALSSLDPLPAASADLGPVRKSVRVLHTHIARWCSHRAPNDSRTRRGHAAGLDGRRTVSQPHDISLNQTLPQQLETHSSDRDGRVEAGYITRLDRRPRPSHEGAMRLILDHNRARPQSRKARNHQDRIPARRLLGGRSKPTPRRRTGARTERAVQRSTVLGRVQCR